MAKFTLEELRSEYNSLLQTCEIRADKLREVQDICDTILANKSRYEAIATATSVPWFMVAAIHSLEGSLNFNTHLHNGDPLKARTVNVPAGRPKSGSPPFTFEESAIDALALDKVAVNLEPTFAGICFKMEGFNGFGSRARGIHTPYLWSFSNQYAKGKFVRDGVFDPDAVSKQCGAAVILRRLLEMKAIEFDEVKQPKLKDDPGIVFSNKKSSDPAMVERVKRFQRMLNTQPGVFLKTDGAPGEHTSDAVLQVFGHRLKGDPRARDVTKTRATPSLAGEGKIADSRSEKNIATLLPRVRPFARALIEKAANQGIIIKVTSGSRSFAEQDELFAQGRTKRGKIVSNARGGFSNHNFGIAFDVTIFKGSTDPEKATTPVFESPVYKAIGALGTELGLEWGGNWKTIVDEPHFQLRPGWAADLREREMLAELRERKDSGKDFFA
jgi:lysozyme family protein